jgi:hypothetical protein
VTVWAGLKRGVYAGLVVGLFGFHAVPGCGGRESGGIVIARDGDPCVDIGSMAIAADGCNGCTCERDGHWLCSHSSCRSRCKDGDTAVDSCGSNTCTCREGLGWECTREACPELCRTGETKVIFCNTCSCVEKHWACTTAPCGDVADCPAPAGRPPPCRTMPEVVKDPIVGTCCAYSSECEAPDGWRLYPDRASCESAR